MSVKSWFSLVVVLMVIVLSGLNSCYYDSEDYLYGIGACTDTTYSYNGRVKSIMDQNCATTGCHAGPSPEASIALDSYAAVKNNAENGAFFCSITWSSGCSAMPKNSSKLDNCTLSALENWRTKGYPEN